MTPDEATAREVIGQLETDFTLMPDTQPGWFCVKEHELIDAIARALRERYKEGQDDQRDERDRLIYWLLECYRTLTRDASVDDGMTDGEMIEALCCVLTNRDLDPNTADGKEHLMEWSIKPNRERY